MASKAKAEKRLRQQIAAKRARVLGEIRRLLDKFPCPGCGRKVTADRHLRIPVHDADRGVVCHGSRLEIAWFDDGLAAVPDDRSHEPASLEARERLLRSMAPSVDSEHRRKSTSVVGDRPTRGGRRDVSGGLPGLKR